MVLDPEALLVAADSDVVVGEDEAAEAVLEGGEGGDELVLLLVGEFPNSDSAVLVGGEDPAAAEGDGLGGAVAAVEGVEVGVGDGLVDVDLVAGGGIEEAVVDGEEVAVGAAMGGEAGEEGGGGGGGGGVEGGEGEFLERRDGGEGEEREIGLNAAAGVCLGIGVAAAAVDRE